jgi:hypothetical protein
VFVHLVTKGVLDLGASEDKKPEPGANAKNPVKTAAMNYYKTFVRTLLTLLLHRHDQVKVLPTPPLCSHCTI